MFQGITRLSLVRIPYFKEVLLESFSCDHCGFQNTSVKSAGTIHEKGTKFRFKLTSEDDFQRQIVKTESAVLKVEDLDLEALKGPGQLTNLESIFSKILTDLQSDQPARKKEDPTLHDVIEGVIQRLIKMLNYDAFPVTVSIDDPSGNSFIEPSPSDKDGKYLRIDYTRSHEQNVALGLVIDDEDEALSTGGENVENALTRVDIMDGEIYEIPARCPECLKDCTVNAKKVKIPHFKDVIIMATVCEHCGYRTNEVKTGGEIPEFGQRITLQVRNVEDLSRDILKSETCVLKSPELHLEVLPGTLGGRFTTVEGVLTEVRNQLHSQIFDVDGDEEAGCTKKLVGGDAMLESTRAKWETFFAGLDQAIKAKFEFSIVLEDPLANSFVQPLDRDDSGEDEQIKKEYYERSEEEREELGLNDMRTEGYEDEEEV